ncbi:glutathione S-transferase family protein [Roseibium sp.]|uniref:glutathione S-transferase family protein n=1 Tax=Roseibium sp. TaxID=1936156 RepID=UPI003A9690B3
MIKVLGRPNSVNVQKVMWCAAELGLEVERTDIGGAFGGNDQPEYLAQNPNGRIPTLVDGDHVQWESNAIVRYLCDRYGSAPWQPGTAQLRGHAGQWMDWYVTSVHPPMTTLFWQLVRTPVGERDPLAMTAALNEAGKLWAILDRHLQSRNYILGDEVSMADIPLGCSAYRWHCMEFDRPDLPALKAWWQRLSGRPAYREHVMLPIT